ncbi:NAD(P)-dependent dehydrogenase, short-chain alcohol dehydrogenase family [Ferrithrix thermotolerans DSM 19514]|uniref:NAD(P)-dependent dehydrogenase, short-chain alcohol dehydrogenase family n=1 Tax=Ferrithrix thermotolerans DSM 19514 TaxID=1121881 RepID=A0A1M4VSL5_9ACTN|nr:SDR family oxidoreductase [Ferrithrix thermotolerans]SHE72121.1 NAD(P)-dependent dehydrogenase, short-chain alcohol dehydrogenase family [Ferrithrix thermotolerans DSM 19514]
MPEEALRDHTLNLFSLADETFMVTGASSGLGVEASRILHRFGAKLVLVARRKDRLERLSEELPGSVPYACDLSESAAIDKLWKFCDSEVGLVTGLVNNAGVSHAASALDETDEEFRAVVEVNLNAVFSMSRRFAQRLVAVQRAGVIVNVASIFGIVGSGQVPLASYSASKAGVVNLTRELAIQWARHSIRVNAVAPGWFHSEMTSEMFEDDGAMHWIQQRTPLGRPGNTGELDGAFIYLASRASSYVTGQTLVVDGGWSTL